MILQIDWGLGERTQLRVVVPARNYETTGLFEYDSSGLGDVEVWGRWSLGPEGGRQGGAVGTGLALPTGRDVDADLTQDNNVAFGAGEFSLLLSLEGFRRLNRRQTLYGLLQYRDPLGSGDNGYRFADDFGWATTWQWKADGGIGFSLGLSGQHLGQDEQFGDPVDNRGGRLHYVSGGINFPGAGDKDGIGVVVQHLVEQDVRGDQLLSPWNFLVAYTFSWGEHTHDDDH